MDPATSLPADVFRNILSRTPLETVDMCKTISKEWREEIYSPEFMHSYCNNNNNVFHGYLIQILTSAGGRTRFISIEGENYQKIKLKSLEVVLASCNQGLVISEYGASLSISKPTTGYNLCLRGFDKQNKTFSVGIVVIGLNPLRYKLVRLTYITQILEKNSLQNWIYGKTPYLTRLNCNEIRCEIYDSKVREWRQPKSIILPPLKTIKNMIPAVSVSTSIYWLTNKDSVISFNGRDESFDEFPLPDVVINGAYKYARIQEFQGKLGLIFQPKDGRRVELWLWQMKGSLENYQWHKRMEVDIEHLRRRFDFTWIYFHNEEIIWMNVYNEMVFYNLKSCGFRRVKMPFDKHDLYKVFQFRSDSKPVCLQKRRRV